MDFRDVIKFKQEHKALSFFVKYWSIIQWVLVGVVVSVVIFLSAFNAFADNLMELYQRTGSNVGGSDIDKRLSFVTSYTRQTGDITFAMSVGLTKEEAETIAIGSSTGDETGYDSGVGDIVVQGNITVDDLTDLAREICKMYLIAGRAYYVSDRGNVNSDVSYGTLTYNDIEIPPYVGSDGSYYRCCNGLSSAILKGSEITTFRDGSSISYPYISCTDIYNKIGTVVNVDSFGDLKVGDIICVDAGDHSRVCHVETVVLIDSSYVYIASAGNNDGILKTAQDGYTRKFEHGERLEDFYCPQVESTWGGLKGVVRP